MIRQCSELSAQCYGVHIPTPPSKRSTTTALHSTNAAAKRSSIATDEYDFEMELDEQLGVHNGQPWENEADAKDGQEDDDDDKDRVNDEDGDDEVDESDARESQLHALTDRMLAYGMELRTEFANDQRREVKKALEDTFALVAYENVRESSLAPLLDAAGRVPVAEELNSAILGMLSFFFFFFSPEHDIASHYHMAYVGYGRLITSSIQSV
jgi:Ran-binding protein 9/10